MKKIYFVFAIIIATLSAQAQQNVTLKINHLLGGSPFAINQTTSNDLGNQFTIYRLQYYISEISLTHDNGQTTSLRDTYILVDATQPVDLALGSFNITTLESISFGIGVGGEINNADPNLQAATHPLAPKSPSMHWGWASGYRFVALEGYTGTNMSQVWQIHALGARNFRTQTIVTAGKKVNGVLQVELDADYTQALSRIRVDGNLLNHGESNEAASLLVNYRTGVFSQSTVGLKERSKGLVAFKVSPNPSAQDITINVDASYKNLSYVVFDLTGREVASGSFSTNDNNRLSIENKGIYMLNVYDQEQLVGSEKVIIQ